MSDVSNGEEEEVRIPEVKNYLDVDLEKEETLLLETSSFQVLGKEFLTTRDLFSNYDRNFDHVWICVKGELKLHLYDEEVYLKEGDMQRIPSGTSYGNVECKGGTRVLVLKGK